MLDKFKNELIANNCSIVIDFVNIVVVEYICSYTTIVSKIDVDEQVY